MRNIILQDWMLEHIDALLSIEDVFISVLVVDIVNEERQKIIDKYADRIGRVYYRNPLSYEDFFEQNKNDYSLNFAEIEKYRKTQLKVEHDFHRVFSDYSEAQYRYLEALTFWLDVFYKNDIDCVLSLHLNHGGFYDTICYDIAIEKGISVYIQEIELDLPNEGSAFYFRCINDSTLVDIKGLEGVPKLELDKFIFNKTTSSSNPYPKIEIKEKYKKSIFKKFIEYLKYKKYFKYQKIRKIFYKKTNDFKTYYTRDPEEIFKGAVYLDKLQKAYNKISKAPDFQEKYVFYALHFEPESTILNRGEINNQLSVIKMISEALPKGWKLYVKEHPWMFRYVKDYEFYFKGLSYFKSFQFYRNILELGNTELINLDVRSKFLIQNAQAVATICGTVVIETITSKKPILIFGPRSTAFSHVEDTFSINSKNDLLESMKKIENNFMPEYKNINEVISKYMLETKINDSKENKRQFYYKIFNHILTVDSAKHNSNLKTLVS